MCVVNNMRNAEIKIHSRSSFRAFTGRDALNISQIWYYKNSLLSSLCEIARFSIRHLFPVLFNKNFLLLFIFVSRFDIRFHSKKGMIGSLRGWQAVSVGILCRLKFKMMKDTRRDVGINWILPRLVRYVALTG